MFVNYAKYVKIYKSQIVQLYDQTQCRLVYLSSKNSKHWSDMIIDWIGVVVSEGSIDHSSGSGHSGSFVSDSR